MSSRSLLNLRKTLAFRLTLWYAVIFTISSFIAFLITYHIISSILSTRTDEALVRDVNEFKNLFLEKGLNEAKLEVIREAEAAGIEKIFFRLISLYGEQIATSDMSPWGAITIERIALREINKGTSHYFETLTIPGREYGVRTIYGKIGTDLVLQIGLSLQEDAKFLLVFREIFGFTMIFIILLAAVIGWFMARKALIGVEEVTHAALEISQGGALERRVPVKTRGDEIERLAATFNSMLDRIHALVAGIKEMSDNIAHDLKSPIARIRGNTEITFTNGVSVSEFRDMAADTIEECDQLLGMINTMLDISEAETCSHSLNYTDVDLSEIILDACELFAPIAEDKCITLTKDIPQSCVISGDLQGLQRMVANLIDNALKYTPSEGTVSISIHNESDNVIISIKDTGIGISEEDVPHIFKRFYRCDKSRSESGVGLGLSLAHAIVQKHRGKITVTSKINKGSLFAVTLPKKQIV
ncbi:MAG: sensor histidine kinase [bacterium]